MQWVERGGGGGEECGTGGKVARRLGGGGRAKSKGPPMRLGGPLVKVVQPLEDNLRNQLHVELLARTEPRRAIEVANRVGYIAESIGQLSRASVIRCWTLVAGIEVRRIVASHPHPSAPRSEI